MRLLRKKKEVSPVGLDEIRVRVDLVEERVETVTNVLIETVDDPWAQNILRSIYGK